jgi:predicted O-linked N-acetylglucosamine transferase (SPINDLY family)
LLKAVALDDLVAANEDAYVRRAVALANDLDGVTALHAGLRERMRRSELCDGAAFAAAMETTYREMWLAWCDG